MPAMCYFGRGVRGCLAALLFGPVSTAAYAADAIPIADFEGQDYGEWKVTGDAFGPGPARGTLPEQMEVTGFEGKGLVNSYYGGDGTIGALTSPPFVIERKCVNFLIGGGCHPGKACINLLIDGKVVRTATGPNRKPGGTERLDPYSWDVTDLKGKTACIEILDNATGGWGHINIDHIRQSDRRTGVVSTDKLYQETYRPQFHFTAKKNWLNDPNGLVCYKGEYHLFFQHNPSGIDWGNMTWGHAVSPDMLHWKQLPNALEPDELGTIFSGSAVVDWNNTSGFQTGDENVLVAFYTSAGPFASEKKPCTQSIAYSNDRGRTWTKYQKNPVVGHIKGNNRDPKVIWYAPSGKWIMALYLDGHEYALLSSSNLKQWTRLCDIEMPGVRECPDLFELPVDGDAKNTKCVFWGANGNYLIGTFDGKTFTKQTEPLRSEWGKNGYAGQTWSDIPDADGRRLQILWMNGGRFPGMPFNQQMSFPCQVTLRTFPEGIRLCRRPVREIENLHRRHHNWSDVALKPGENLLAGISGELFDIRAEIKLGQAGEVGFVVRGIPVVYSAKANKLACLGKSAPLDALQGRIKLQILVDRTSIEIFANDGRVAMSYSLPLVPDNRSLEVFARDGNAMLTSVNVWHLKSTWPQ